MSDSVRRGGGTPLYKPYIYVPPQMVGFLCRCGLKKGILYTLPILVWNRVRFSRELRDCMNVFILSIPNVVKRKRNMRIRKGF